MQRLFGTAICLVMACRLAIGGSAGSKVRDRQEADHPARPKQVITLPRRKLVFKPTRDDITVGAVILSLYRADLRHLDLKAIRVNGTRPETASLYLKQVGRNRFELPALKIEVSGKALGGPLYISLKAWFNEVTNQYDSPFYVHVPDRYALLSYCTNENDDPSKVNARLGANRVATLKEFQERLSRPFVLRLKQRPLREEWGYPTLPPGNRLSTDDLKAVEKAVRDRGERHLTSISVDDADHATVSVGSGTFLPVTRVYKVVRCSRAWRVESVKTAKVSSWSSGKERKAAMTDIRKLGGEIRFDQHQKVYAVILRGPNVRDTALAQLKAIPEIREITLDKTKVTNAGLAHLKGLKNLKKLGIYDTAICDAGLKHLRGMTQMERFTLYSTDVAGPGLKSLQGWKKLRSLSLDRTEVTDAALKHVKGLTGLTTLDLSRTNVTDAGLQHLQGLTNLSSLSLYETAVGNAGLKHLRGLKKLRLLMLRHTRVTGAGVRKLQRALPNCIISWSEGREKNARLKPGVSATRGCNEAKPPAARPALGFGESIRHGRWRKEKSGSVRLGAGLR